MGNFDRIKQALQYIDDHLEEPLSVESVAGHFHFSPYYFHRMFTAIVGQSLAAHIRGRRLARACVQLCRTDLRVIDIALACGYHAAQSFSRAFSGVYGLSPRAYRKRGELHAAISVEEMIEKFTNRLRGGITLHPNIIKRGALRIAGVSGDGADTWGVWQAFETLSGEKPLVNALSTAGYEIRVVRGDVCTVHVGYAVSDGDVDAAYALMQLPASRYASFDVYVAKGYDSENSAMEQWLAANGQGYRERLLGDAHYCVEYYDQRFQGGEAGSIVEIWIPIQRE